MLVTDITGFTRFADATEPEYVFETLAEAHGLVGKVVEALDGEVLDITGDTVMAIFSGHGDGDEAVERSARAALAIQAQTRDLVTKWRKRGQDLGFKMTLNAGFATVGHVRAGSYAKYAAVGSTVNTVFHLGRVCRDGEILATKRVADHAAGIAAVIARPDLELAALVRKVRIFELRPL